jgi:hypothetical protein
MIGEAAPRELHDVRRVLGSLEFNQLLHLVIRRNQRTIPISIIVVPPTDGPADWLTSEVDSAVLDRFDPMSSRSYAPPSEPEPAGAYARLVSLGDRPQRIDVMHRDRLVECWILDDNGRPVLGLYADPAPDGAMRIEIERDESGEVSSERRIDERGLPVRPQ